MNQTQVPPHLHIDPYAVETLLDPYPFHQALRDTSAVVWLPQYEVYAVGRHADVAVVMKDYERFSSIAGIGLIDKRDPESEKLRKTSPMTEADPPVHTKTRVGMQKLLSPVVVRGWRARYEQVAAGIVDRVQGIGGAFDAVPELAEDMVYTVIPESLGLDVPREHLPGIGEMNFFSLGPMNELRRKSLARVQDAVDYYDRAAERENVKPGTFGDVIYQAEDAGVFEPGIGIGLVRTFLRGGTDTSIAAIASLLMLLAQNPDQWRKLKADPSRLKIAFEETLRLESPSQNLYRLVTQDMVFQGFELEGGRKIAFYPGAANRDPRFWSNADRFDLDRDIVGQHLAFGAGAHVCIGQMIARLVVETLMQALMARIDDIRLAGEPQWRPVSALRSLRSLPIEVTWR
ncbi:cytochrome P450 [Variovorax sp. KK3]|uniref:cytochrome P450 n=1 Tax=Variovorax sp. KK3 TaxID=1855728 RepID=UPI0011816DE9|nr:cytochrome P450 [Variovorax sp. KK3]